MRSGTGVSALLASYRSRLVLLAIVLGTVPCWIIRIYNSAGGPDYYGAHSPHGLFGVYRNRLVMRVHWGE